MSPFIAPRLSAKTVESIWTEAASSDLTLCPKCEDVAEPVGGGKRQCISCYHTFTPAQKAAAADPSSPRPTQPCSQCGHPIPVNHGGLAVVICPSCLHSHIGARTFDPNGKWCEGTGDVPLRSGGMNVAGGCPKCYEKNPDLSDGGTIKAHNPQMLRDASKRTAKEQMTVEQYRAKVDAEIADRKAKGNSSTFNLRGLHNFAKDVEVPGASHAQLVHTQECYSPGCPDHGWM